MNGTSRYYQINENILLEYIYTDRNNPEVFNTQDFPLSLIGNSESRVNNLFSDDSLEEQFKNVRDLSSILLETGKYGYLDIDKPTALNDEIDYLTNSDNIDIEFVNNYDVAYDRFKIHFASGYTFEQEDGFLFEAQVKDKFDKKHNLSSLTYLASDSYARINPRPFLIGGTEYSSYVEVIIPSLYDLIGVQNQFPEDLDKLGYKLTNNVGLIADQNLSFKVSAIQKTERKNNQRYFETSEDIIFTIPIEDEFEGITAKVEEADDGDYYILYASFDSGSIQDYITRLNRQPNSNWVILHNLFLVEQLGDTFYETSSESWIQDSNFEDVRFWRPVIRNSTAVSYSVDYTIRLFNRATNEQIIKRSVVSFSDVVKYSKSLKRINLGTIPTVDEIYNLVGGNSIQMEGFRGNSTGSVEFVPNFFEKNNVLISNINTFQTENGDESQTLQENGEDFYKQGELRISISPFDNYLKFVLFISQKNQINLLNLTQLGDLKISFRDNNDDNISFSSITTESVNTESGEVLFYIPESEAKKITKFSNREFYIIIRGENNKDNLVYSGTFEPESNRTSRRGRNYITKLETKNSERADTIEKLNRRISEKEREIEVLKARISTKDEEIQFLRNPNSTVQKTSPAGANLQNRQNQANNIKVSTSDTTNKQRVVNKKKGSSLKNTKINRNL